MILKKYHFGYSLWDAIYPLSSLKVTLVYVRNNLQCTMAPAKKRFFKRGSRYIIFNADRRKPQLS